MVETHYSRSLWDKIQDLDEPCVRTFRDQINGWLEAAPPDERTSFEALLKSDDEKDFYATSLELYLSHFLRSHGWPVERHPKLEGSRRRPDFRVVTPAGPVYIEATTVLESDGERTNGRLERLLKDHLRSVTGPFKVTMTVLTPIPGGFSGRHAQKWLRSKLLALPDPLPEDGGRVPGGYRWQNG